MNKKLEELKKIPLDQFCIDQLGYTPDKSKDSTRWRVLVSREGFKIITDTLPKRSGHYLFFCPDKDVRGSIINLLIQLHGYTTTDILIEFCGGNMPKYIPQAYDEVRCGNSTESVKELYINYLDRCTNSGHNYLTKRGISMEVINYFKIPVAERELFLPLYILDGGKWKVSTAIRYIFDQYNEKKRYFLERKKGFKKWGLLQPAHAAKT